MKKYLHYFGVAAVTALAVTAVTSCSSDYEDFPDFAAWQSESQISRSTDETTDSVITIGFEDYAEYGIVLAGPTSYGENLYASYSGTNNPIENVKTIKFNFSGSDNSEWGLNTPAYICIDNIKIAR